LCCVVLHVRARSRSGAGHVAVMAEHERAILEKRRLFEKRHWVQRNGMYQGTPMTISILLHWNSAARSGTAIAAWTVGSCVTAELLGYWLHRLMHSGAIRLLSRNHMKHHLIFYGPLQKTTTGPVGTTTGFRFIFGDRKQIRRKERREN
jgi:hypothetical protein